MKEFESKRGLSDRRSSRSKARVNKSADRGSDDEDGNEEDGDGDDQPESVPDPKEVSQNNSDMHSMWGSWAEGQSALGSIMDFLGDQSD